MKKINILPPQIFNLLAAGEVVENPSSIIKECVENSLDAGATQVTVAIKNGGMTEIAITDNGSGVAPSCVEKIFIPHATSKIAQATDLESIQTLGFCGEAMSSIAAVSQVTLTTCTTSEKTGTRIELSSGEVTKRDQIAANIGTQIVVKNLFFNTPARKKFLKPEHVERNNIMQIIQKFILANPEIAFKYTVDGETIYNYLAGDVLSAIQTIYNREITANLIKVQTPDISGYISIPSFSRRNRTYQTTLINNRVVEGGLVAAAVADAYQNYQTAGNFPFYVLNLTIPPDQIDVNVHPRKLEIHFQKPDQVHEQVKTAITEALDKYLHQQSQVFSKPNETQRAINKVTSTTLKHFLGTSTTNEVKSAPNILNMFDEKYFPKTPLPTKKSKPVSTYFNIIGTIFDCYILLLYNERFIILDQHAAHERLLYDRLRIEVDSGEVVTQPLLEPKLVYLTPPELTRIQKLLPDLEKLGFSMEVFGGNCIRVVAAPLAIVTNGGLDLAVNEVLSELRKVNSTVKISDVLKERLISAACRAAIKAGQPLAHEQIEFFLKQFRGERTGDYQSPLHCPHGRPILVAYTREQLEKLFSRK